MAKVSLRSEDFGLELQVELNVERCVALATGDVVYVAPRRVRVFVPEETGELQTVPEYVI